jgi:hypothetical protein
MTKPLQDTTASKSDGPSWDCRPPERRPGQDEYEYRVMIAFGWFPMHRPDKVYGCTCKRPLIDFSEPTPTKGTCSCPCGAVSHTGAK